jgi:glycosyltransferase involved in cell wall biosynthesis
MDQDGDRMTRTDNQRQTPTTTPSVVVPNLNNARFIEHTLNSLASQGADDLDVVIVDGGSTDGSVEIIERWARQHGARWLSEPDEGQAQAINKGFRMATGDVVTWINSDDLAAPGAIRRVVAEFSADPSLDFLWGVCLEIDADGRPLRILNPTVVYDLSKLRVMRNFVPQPASWYRRSVFGRFGLLDEGYHYSFDYEFFLRLAGHCNARFIPQVLAEFRIHPSSKTGSSAISFLREETRAFRAHGGRWASPFTLELIKNWLWNPAWSLLTSPIRWTTRMLFRAR